jgi:hypothetical protein
VALAHTSHLSGFPWNLLELCSSSRKNQSAPLPCFLSSLARWAADGHPSSSAICHPARFTLLLVFKATQEKLHSWKHFPTCFVLKESVHECDMFSLDSDSPLKASGPWADWARCSCGEHSQRRNWSTGCGRWGLCVSLSFLWQGRKPLHREQIGACNLLTSCRVVPPEPCTMPGTDSAQ